METFGPEELKKVTLFQNLDDDEIAKILGLAERRNYGKGEVVFRQDQEAKRLFIVEDGTVAMIMKLRPGTERTVVTEGRGGAFGWSALLPPYRHTTLAKCREPSQLLEFEGARIRELCYQEPLLGVKVMEGLAQFIANRVYWTNLRLIDAMWI